MSQVKSFVVNGETTTRNGKKEKNIASNVDAVINEFISGVKVVDIKTCIDFGTAGIGDWALVTILYEGEPAQPKKVGRPKKS